MIKKLSSEKKSELIESAVAFIVVAGIFMILIWAVYAAGNAFAEYKAADTGLITLSEALELFGETDRLCTFSELNSMGIDLDTLEIVGSVHNGPRRFEER